MKLSFIWMLLLSICLIQDVAAQEESVPHRVGASLKKGGEAVANGVKQGAEAAGKGIKKAGSWVGKKMQQGGEKLEKASK
jgi:hypothetical protein